MGSPSVDLPTKDLVIGKVGDRQITEQDSLIMGRDLAEVACSEKGSLWAGQGVDVKLTALVPFLDLLSAALTRGEFGWFFNLII